MKDNKNKDKKGALDLSLIIDQHKREIWAYKMKESEWIKTKNQLDGHKSIVNELSAQVISLKKELDRLAEENNNIRTIDGSHKSLNGDLQKQLQEAQNELTLIKTIGLNSPEMIDLKKRLGNLELENKALAEKVSNYQQMLSKAGL
jgi:chromosome segregation ATPase